MLGSSVNQDLDDIAVASAYEFAIFCAKKQAKVGITAVVSYDE